MLKYKNLTIIGTSHIAKQSLREVEQIIKAVKPDVVALELDKKRFIGLTKPEMKKKPTLLDIGALGFKGYLFAKLGEYAERKLGASVGVKPGDEMMKATQIASEVGAKVALVDQPIEVTMKNFSNNLTWKERFRFVGDVCRQVFKRKKNRKLPFDLNKVPGPEVVEKLIGKMKGRYPNVYKALVADRNVYMGKRLFKLMNTYEKVVAVVGAGHSKEMIEEIRLIEKNKNIKLE